MARPSKAARRSSGRQSNRSTKDEIDAFMAGEDENVVEGLVDEEEEGIEAEDENLTPIPDEIFAQQEKITPLASKKRSTGKGAVAPGPDSGNEVEAVQDAEGEIEGEEEEEDLYSPGTLGTYPHSRSEVQADNSVWAKRMSPFRL